jgi:OOP family OmpA-OmpF porin
MFKKTLIAAAIASMAGGAYAETTGFYMGGGVGVWNIDESGIIEDTAMVARINGGYKFNEYFGIEGSYVHLAEVEDDSVLFAAEAKLDGSAWEFSLRPSYPLTDRLEGYARLGWGTYDMELDVSVLNQSFNESESDDGFVWAVGSAWAMNESFNLYGEYSQPDTEADIYIMTFGATYNF